MDNPVPNQDTVRRPRGLTLIRKVRYVPVQGHPPFNIHMGGSGEFQGNGLDVIQVIIRVAHHLVVPEFIFLKLFYGSCKFPLSKLDGVSIVTNLQFRQLMGQRPLSRRRRSGIRELPCQHGAWRAGHPLVRPRRAEKGMFSLCVSHQICAPIPRSAVANAPYCSGRSSGIAAAPNCPRSAISSCCLPESISSMAAFARSSGV